MKVETLQALISRVTSKIKVNKFIPLTAFVGVKTREGKLVLVATDGSNYVSGSTETDMQDGVDISVDSDLFSKLISALAPEVNVELSVENNNLRIKNESIDYTVPAISDDSGIIKYPEVTRPAEAQEFDLKKFSEAYNKVQNSVDPQSLVPYMSAVYVSDVMLGTNNYLLAKSNCGNLFGQPVLLPLPLCENIMQIVGDKASYNIADGYLTVFTESTIVRGKLHEGINDYPVDAIKALFENSIENHASVNTGILTSAIGRVSLFISDFDDNGIKVSFGSDKMSISSVSRSGHEDVGYDSHVRLLTRFLKSFTAPAVNISYTDTQIIGSKDDTEVILSLMED
jgi:DNA polymerase III sliding clamp (beta) subunit (PCNA family)